MVKFMNAAPMDIISANINNIMDLQKLIKDLMDFLRDYPVSVERAQALGLILQLPKSGEAFKNSLRIIESKILLAQSTRATKLTNRKRTLVFWQKIKDIFKENMS